ncbi:hypothetical protein Tco_1192622 [Tanacetum coccineum]
MEEELYNLTVKGNDLKPYVRRFQELTVLCPDMVPNTEKLLEAFIGGLPRSIEGNVNGSSNKTYSSASIKYAGDLPLCKKCYLYHTGPCTGSGYHQKDRKPSQNDKTEHGMEKTVQNQGQSPKIPKSESILKNQQSNRSRRLRILLNAILTPSDGT